MNSCFCRCSSTKYSAPKLRERWLLLSPKSFQSQNEDTVHSFQNNWGIILFYISGRNHLPGNSWGSLTAFQSPLKDKGPRVPLDPSLHQPVVKPILHHPIRSVSNCLYFPCHKAVWSLCTVHGLCYVNLCSSPSCCSMRNLFCLQMFPYALWYCYISAAYREYVWYQINTKKRRKKKRWKEKINNRSKSFNSIKVTS